MIRIRYLLAVLTALMLPACAMQPARHLPAPAPALPDTASIDRFVDAVRVQNHAPGLALAIIDHGRISAIRTYGNRALDPQRPLHPDTVMYGASLTKFVFATYVMQLAGEGKLDLDRPVGEYFPKPLTDYPEWRDLAGDPRWHDLTLRRILDHSTGWANYRFFPPEGGYRPHARLKFYYDPGSRYGYSGEGYILAQRVLELGLGIEPGAAMQKRLFTPLGMTRTSMTWQPRFASDFAIGYDTSGKRRGHDMQDNVRAAGSMDTTISDYARFVSAWLRGALISRAAREEMLRPQIGITSAHKFPTLDPGTDLRHRRIGLAAGLGVVVWQSPYGPAFMKGGHNEFTDNMMVCLALPQRCVILMSNTARGDRMYPQIVEYILGGTDFPWYWEYNPEG